jgi:hypothetical protein
MIMKISEWFPQIAGCKVEDESGNVYKVVTYSAVCDNLDWLMIGLEDINGVLRYCPLDRYNQLISIA